MRLINKNKCINKKEKNILTNVILNLKINLGS